MKCNEISFTSEIVSFPNMGCHQQRVKTKISPLNSCSLVNILSQLCRLPFKVWKNNGSSRAQNSNEQNSEESLRVDYLKLESRGLPTKSTFFLSDRNAFCHTISNMLSLCAIIKVIVILNSHQVLPIFEAQTRRTSNPSRCLSKKEQPVQHLST